MTNSNPWKTIESRLVYQNPWIRVREDKVIRPDGFAGIYGVVETKIATGVVAITEQAEIFLIGQYRYPTEVYSWELIEGGTDPDETPLEAAARELQEEAGLIAKTWNPLGAPVHLSNCVSSEQAILFLAEGLTETSSNPEGTEVLEVKKLPFLDCLKMVNDGTIMDAVSIIGIYRAEQVLRQRGLL